MRMLNKWHIGASDTMKSFKQYLSESTREYCYVIKLAQQPTDEQCDSVERYLHQFGLVEVTKPTLLDGDSMDFADIQNHQVWQINFVTTTPLSSYITMQGIRDVLNVPEKLIVVRTAVEPVELNADRHMIELGFRKTAADMGLTPAARLGTDRFYEPIEEPTTRDVFGDSYNKRFLDYLADVKANRPTQEYDASAPLFSWLQMRDAKQLEPTQDTADFNDGYSAPKPVSKPSADAKPPTPRSGLGPEGNFDDGSKHLYTFYRDKDGKRVNLGSPRAPNKTEIARKG